MRCENIEFAGLLTHSGHSYKCRSAEEIRKLYDTQLDATSIAEHAVHQAKPGHIRVSFGDTPCCSAVDDLSGNDELRPGNLVLYDLMQMTIGSCQAKQMAMVLLCPVVASNIYFLLLLF